MQVRILLVDDHEIVRTGLRGMLDTGPAITVVGEARNGHEAIGLVRELAPDLVLMDITMPEMNGIDATRRVREVDPRVRVIGLSMHADRRYVAEFLRAGAAGYLLKSCSIDELRRAIHEVHAGRTYVSPAVAGTVVKDYVDRLDRDPATGSRALSPKEREVLQLLAEGKSTKQIADRLECSTKTIDFHRGNIMAKLDLHSIAELTKYAIREGLTSGE